MELAMYKCFSLCLLLMLSISIARAADYQQAPGSSLGFSTSYQGETFNGRFSKFNSLIRFDPAHLDQSRFDVSIQLNSANTQNSERDAVLLDTDFFNAKAQPQARYTASKFRSLGKNQFIAEGVLSLRGINKAVPLTFSWTPGTKPVLTGTAKIQRLDFKVGTGDWTDLDVIPNLVSVNTKLILSPVTSIKPVATPIPSATAKPKTP
jgi:polyisoprenoid-binding protein YceI